MAATQLDIKKHKENYEVRVSYGSGKGMRSQVYSNILDHNAAKLAQVLLDLEFEGFPISKAVAIYMDRKERKDWLGL
jgi:hypothetical protein